MSVGVGVGDCGCMYVKVYVYIKMYVNLKIVLSCIASYPSCL